MSRKFKSHASSARAASSFTGGFGAGSTFQTKSSLLAYVTEGPDLTRISNSDVVVAFKNLSKKDSTTKAKALEELTERCSSADTEEPILAAWSEIYARTSIDNSRRVRQLAHNIQGTLTSLCGKRIAHLLKKVVGPWLGGTFDSDKVVAKTAQAALEKAFPTDEKRQALWKVYRDAIVEHAEDAILVQTENTLSDERTTSPDDAEAKYVRVVGSGVHILIHLLSDGIDNGAARTFFEDKKLWGLVSSNDPYLRRGICQLIGVACQHYTAQLDWQILSSSFLTKGLQSSQVGSSTPFVETLTLLTKKRPELWTADYVSKTPVSKRLFQFLRKGSQSGPERFWPALKDLLKIVPTQVWLTEDKFDSATAFSEAIRTGVCQPSERINTNVAWKTYVEINFWLMGILDIVKNDFADQHLAPIVLSYVAPDQKQGWTVPSTIAPLCGFILRGLVAHGCESSFTKIWTNIVDATSDAMKLSLPESSKDFRVSQDAVVSQANRLFRVAKEVEGLDPTHPQITAMMQQTLLQLFNSALELLVARNGKPYAAASIASTLVQQPKFDKTDATLQAFITNDLPNLINSPSAEQLISMSLNCGNNNILESLLLNERGNNSQILNLLLKRVTDEQLSSELKGVIQNRVATFANVASQATAKVILLNNNLKGLHSLLLRSIHACLSPTASFDSQQGTLKVLTDVLTSSTSENLLSSQDQQSLLSDLLVLSDSDSDNAEQAQILISKINTKRTAAESSNFVIQQQLSAEGAPLSIFTLIEVAENALKLGALHDDIFPSDQQWQKALHPHLHSPRPFDLTITNPMQGVLYDLVNSSSSEVETIRDSETLSMAFRLSLYTTKLLSPSATLHGQQRQALDAMQKYLPVALALVNEKLTDDDANDLWLSPSASDIQQEAMDVLSAGNRLIQSWLPDEDDDFTAYWTSRAQSFEEASIATYSEATAWINVVSQIIDQSGPARVMQQYEETIKHVSQSTQCIKSAALLSVLRDHLSTTTIGKRLCNELVASATMTKTDLRSLTLLNVFLDGQSTALEAVPNQRIVFLLKNLVSLLARADITGLEAESVKLLAAILPLISDIYGEHWDTIINYVAKSWRGDTNLTLINATLRLYSKLYLFSQHENANEDLTEALAANKQALDEGLVNCLFTLATNDQGMHQPRDITAELLRRVLKGVHPHDIGALYELLSSHVEAIQNTAYDILNREIPALQEQLSIDMVLEKKVVHLPEDLMSHLSEPSNPKEYLLSWSLIFDHFPKASYVLRECYVNDVKQSGHLSALLDFVCQITRISSGRPIDASKFSITNYDVDGQSSTEKELQHLSIFIYYNILLFLPSLAKDWFISQKNRIKSPLESWTQKHISPSVISTSVSAVMAWASEQSDDDRPLEIKSTPKGSEVIASIEIDPENPPISLSVSLPGTYPLDQPIVTSRTRVGVSEKNWQSWLRTFQIIIFSTGSIIEGLIAFRHNVQGALKGQSECAICYSIIGTDKQTPNKKCNTCKNNFHGSCLFRWFKSSNSSSCPLCRNNFNYA